VKELSDGETLMAVGTCIWFQICGTVRPKFGFGFGYGVETDLTYGFGLVSATAKVHWYESGFGRNITPKL